MAGSSLLAVSNTDSSVWRAPLAPSHMLNSSSFGCQRISSYLLEPLWTIIQTGSTIKFTVFHRKSPMVPLSMLQRHICLNETFRLILNLQDLLLLPLNSGGLISSFKSRCTDGIVETLRTQLFFFSTLSSRNPLHTMWLHLCVDTTIPQVKIPRV